jgi:hypothetical protein
MYIYCSRRDGNLDLGYKQRVYIYIYIYIYRSRRNGNLDLGVLREAAAEAGPYGELRGGLSKREVDAQAGYEYVCMYVYMMVYGPLRGG